jgi:hypothetical protein
VSSEVRVEKHKWDGRVSAVDDRALLVLADAPRLAWYVPAGSERAHPTAGSTEVLAHDELWLTVTDEWWVLCAEGDGDEVDSLVLHAAVPVEGATTEPIERIEWIDLDLDLEVRDGELSLEDEEQFHQHAATMSYPRDVIRGAWAGISRMAPRYTMGEWPFDGWLQQELARARASPRRRSHAGRPSSSQGGDARPTSGS